MARIELGLRDYWLIIRKRRWIIIITFFAIFLSVVIHTQLQPPVYKAVSSIRMIERKSVSDMITQMVSYTSFDALSSMAKVLVGRPIIEKVVYDLGLADKNTPPEKLENTILDIQGAVNAESVMGTNVVNISVEYRDSEMAAKIANTVAEVFIKADTEEQNERARNVRIFVEQQQALAKQRLTEAEDKIKVFKEKGEATGIAVILQNNIAELERQKIELRKIYTERYPDVVKINEQIKELTQQLQALPESEVEYGRLTRELEVNEKSYLLLQGKLEEARIAEAEKVQTVKVVNYAMAPKVPIKPKKQLATVLGLVMGLIIGVFLSFVVETLDTSIGTIDDLEALLKLPVLAVIPYMKTKTKEKSLRDWLSWRTWKVKLKIEESPEDLEDMRQQILLRHIQRSSTMEAYRILRTNINVEELIKNNQRILLMTSTVPREGKSITAVNLTLALAQDGYKTLLVDCDLRKAVIHKIFNVDKEPGFTNIILDTNKPETAIRNLIDIMMSAVFIKDVLKAPGLDNFHLLTCGKIVVNPAELLDSAATLKLFATLKAQFDFVIVDAPPVLPVPDAIILGSKVADKLYLVYRASYTSKVAISRAKEQLAMMKTIPSGVILNSTTPESQIVSDYYHHYYHYRYYSDKEKE